MARLLSAGRRVLSGFGGVTRMWGGGFCIGRGSGKRGAPGPGARGGLGDRSPFLAGLGGGLAGGGGGGVWVSAAGGVVGPAVFWGLGGGGLSADNPVADEWGGPVERGSGGGLGEEHFWFLRKFDVFENCSPGPACVRTNL